MLDRIPTPGQEGRVLVTPEDGGAPFYAKIHMADNPTQEGTPLNKASLLKDSTAALYGMDPSAVPDDALALLSRFHNGLGNEYLWYCYKTTYKDNFYWETTENFWVGTTTVTKTYYCSSSVEIDDNNNAVLKNSTTITIGSLSDYYSLRGKYYTEYGPSIPNTNYNYLAYISPNASFTKDGVNLICSSGKTCSLWVKESINVGEYVNSQDPNAYPPSVSDGYTYTLLGQFGDKVRIATGSYTGTGSYQNYAKVSITVGFTPKFIAVVGSSNNSARRFLATPVVNGVKLYASAAGTNGYPTCVTGNDTGVEWYTTQEVVDNLNVSGVVYYWIAIA